MSAVILCGGHSRRMGRDKAGLPWGGGTLLDTMLHALSSLDEVFLSADCAERYSSHACRVVEDQYPNSGPLGGLCSALLACRTPLLFAVGCDMPLVTSALAEALRERITAQAQSAVPQDASGRIHPLCALYRRTAAPVLVQQLRSGNFRLRSALSRLDTLYIPAWELPGGEMSLTNLNTPGEYAALVKNTANVR